MEVNRQWIWNIVEKLFHIISSKKNMKTINFLFVLSLIFVFSFSLVAPRASAQTSFPDGCASALGYSVTNGAPCNGRGVATMGPLPGCETALGYSATNGAPCSGGSIALFYLAGCSSIYGYSTVNGQPCNGGASVASAPGTGSGIPGLPTTGEGGNALKNIALLFTSGAIALLAYIYSKPQNKIA